MHRAVQRGVDFVWAIGLAALYCAAFRNSRTDRDAMTTSEDRLNPVQPGAVAATWRTPALVIGMGCLATLIAFGPRSTLGFFLTPMSSANHWGRDVFAFAIALQNLLWGIGQPLGGMIADRFGPPRVMCAGALLYAAGLALMAHADSAPLL